MILKKINYRHYICIFITIIFLLLSIFYFKYGYIRIYESFIDLFNSIKFYIFKFFKLNLKGNLSVVEYSSVDYVLPWNLPNNWIEFKNLFKNFWSEFFIFYNFKLYLFKILDFLYYLINILFILLIPCLIIRLIYKRKSVKVNNDYYVDSKALIRFKKLEKRVFLPIKNWLLEFISFIKENSIYTKFWLLIWFYNFNFFVIFIEFFAYYIYFISSFDLVSIYVQIIKLLKDLSPMINFIPRFIWFIVAYYLFNSFRIKRGYENLNHMEFKNRGLINSMSLVEFDVGTMGSSKTSKIVSTALSVSCMHRDKALEKILKFNLMFPYFPWILFENEIKNGIKKHYIWNLATCKRFVDSKVRKFNKKNRRSDLFMYDFNKYPLEYDNGLEIKNLHDILIDYAKLFFLYYMNSYIISNLSVRTDDVIIDNGNFPLWDNDLFQKDTKSQEINSRYSIILDYDMFRLGKQIMEKNQKANSFDFGVVIFTEIGKERGNQLENMHLKKDSSTANPKNDLFNAWLKLVRHISTIDNYPFVKILMDDQRPESLGADARELAEIVHIVEKSDFKFCMPFFEIEDLLINFVLNKFYDYLKNYKHYHGDNTLPNYLLKGIFNKILNYIDKIYNTFGYYILNLHIERNTIDNSVKEVEYNLMIKKVYSKRFSTDCFNDVFYSKSIKSLLGMNDLERYNDVKATIKEMQKQNSYFFMDLEKIK